MDFFGDPQRDTGSALTSTIFSQSFLALILAALLLDDRHGLVAYAVANLSLSTLFVGIGALADPQRALRRRAADAALLHTAPISRGSIALARAMHGAFYTALVTTGMAIPPAILCYWVADESFVVVPLYIAHACVLSAACAGGLAIVLRIAEHAAGRAKALLLAGTLRALFLGGGFIAFALCLRALDETAEALPVGRAGAWCWPPYWSARLLQNPLDETAWLALGGLLLLIAVLGTWIRENATPKSRAVGRGRFTPLAALERRLAGPGALRGATRFCATMLYRSPSFRARVLPLLGVPIAMTVLAFTSEDERGNRLLLGMTLQFPTIYLPFLIGFLPNADRKGTGRVFDTSPRATLALAREAGLIALTTRILSPILLVGAGLAIAGGEPVRASLALLLFSWGIAVLMAAAQVQALPAMPFSVDATDQEDADFGRLMAAGLVLGAVGGVFAIFADESWAAALAVVIATFGVLRLRNAPRHADRSAEPA